jgi:hypothetical protein
MCKGAAILLFVEISGYRSNEYEDDSLEGYCSEQSQSVPTYQR